jgi:hypothetical protein
MAGERVHFEPCDRALLLHCPSARIYELMVSRVERELVTLQLDMPCIRPCSLHTTDTSSSTTTGVPRGAPPPPSAASEGARRTRAHRGTDTGGASVSGGRAGVARSEVVLDATLHGQAYELLALFRPAMPSGGGGLPGAYVNAVDRALWLEVDDVIVLTKQGGRVHPVGGSNPHHGGAATTSATGSTDDVAYEPEAFEARVTAVAVLACRIEPVRPIVSRRNATGKPMPRVSGRTRWSNLDGSLTLSGTQPEWVPRNTLRFRRFVRRGSLKTRSLRLSFAPSLVATS